MSWEDIQEEIDKCRRCYREGQYQIQFRRKKLPEIKPENIRLLFISEAPPYSKSYFYWENSPDKLRKRIFTILNEIGYDIKTLSDFVSSGFYLTPTVKCASQRNGKNANPRRRVIKLCISYLKKEMEYIKPKAICLLGRTALYGFSLLFSGKFSFRPLRDVAGQVRDIKIKERTVKVMITYWPSNRQGKFKEIIDHIRIIDSL